MDRGNPVDCSDALVVEKPLQIIVNGNDFSMTMQTPGDEAYLVRGLLHSEGIERSEFIVFGLEEATEATTARVEIECDESFVTRRNIASTSSCGLCGKENVSQLFDGLSMLTNEVEMDAAVIESVYREIDQQDTLFRKTGGCHTATASTREGKLLCLFEDIGRHNAVDKVVGWLLEHDQLGEAALLTVSGRVSFEIIQKCIRARIPVVAAISAPSSMAVEVADQYGVTLAAFCRGKRATFYSHAERINGLKAGEVHHV